MKDIHRFLSDIEPFLKIKGDETREAITVLEGRLQQIEEKKALQKLHGTTSKYSNDKCRCALCREAQFKYGREWRRKRKENKDMNNVFGADLPEERDAK
jgi:hypothetical protein